MNRKIRQIATARKLIRTYCLKKVGKVCYELSCLAILAFLGHEILAKSLRIWHFFKKQSKVCIRRRVTLPFKQAVTPENNFYVAKKDLTKRRFLRKSLIIPKGKTEPNFFNQCLLCHKRGILWILSAFRVQRERFLTLVYVTYFEVSRISFVRRFQKSNQSATLESFSSPHCLFLRNRSQKTFEN